MSLIERTSSPGPLAAYNFNLNVRPEQVTNATLLQAAVDAVRPAGITWTLVQTDGTTWAAESHTWAADTQTWAQKG